jgi:hypothetical protein
LVRTPFLNISFLNYNITLIASKKGNPGAEAKTYLLFLEGSK